MRDMAEFRPYGNRVLIRVNKKLPRDEIAGLIVPDTVKNTALEGDVVALGPERIPEEIKIGIRIACYELAGEIFKYEGDEYLVVGVSDILGIIEEGVAA